MLGAGELLPEPAPEFSAVKRSTVRDSVKLGDRGRERTMAQCLSDSTRTPAITHEAKADAPRDAALVQ